MTSRKILVLTVKWSTSSKIPDFRNGSKSPWFTFSYVGSKFKCLKLIYRWKRNFISINTVLRTRIQKWTCLELLIENRKDMFSKLQVLLKIVKIEKMTQQNQNNCLTKNFFEISYLQYDVYYSRSIILGSSCSTWETIIHCVPQGLVLGTLLFNVF